MGSTISRAQFLRGDISGRSRPLRPPWSLPEQIFVERCTRCGDCIRCCPQHILEPGNGGFPRVDFSRGECQFCGDCARVCAAGALRRDGGDPWTIRAHIGERCLAFHGVECRSCAEPCAPRAIRFRPVAGGVAQPVLEPVACNGCGACYSVCPARAIALHARETAGFEQEGMQA